MHIHPSFHLRELGDDHLVIGGGAGLFRRSRHVVRLNDSAAFLWRSVAEREFDAALLAQLLREEYGLEEAVAAADAASILAAWRKAGLVAE